MSSGQPDSPGPVRRHGGYARFVALRFLRSRRQGFVSLIGLLSALGFLVGVASLIVALAMITGFQQAMITKILGANAQLLVFPGEGRPPRIEHPEELARRVEQAPGVESAAPVVTTKGLLLAAGQRMRWVTVNGIDPATGGRVTDMESYMIAGSLADLARRDASRRPALVLGEQLAAELGVLEGDQLTLLVPRPKLTPWGVSLQRTVFEVVGFFETDYFEYDSGWAFIGLEDARRLLGLGGAAHWIAARVTDIHQLRRIEQRVQADLGEEYRVDDILRGNRALFSALQLEKLLMFLAVSLIVIVAALGVVSTLVLTVTQKVREIGVLSSMGASPAGIMRIFVMQGTSVGLIGTVFGAVTGVGLCFVADRFKLIPLDPSVYYLDHVAFSVRAFDVAAVVVVSAVISFVSTLYPAWRASRLDPVEALRGE